MAWTPSSASGYAGTWLFLFALSIIARALTAGKIALERYWLHKFTSVSFVVSKKDTSQVISGHQAAKYWRTSVDIPRAIMQMIISGVYYLLWTRTVYRLTCRMIAVMTLNVGYFFAVLAGLFFGELFFGRFTASAYGAQDHGGGH
jgi:solute carrier family 31 (copper transporter), member 1